MKNLISISNDSLHTETLHAAADEKAATLVLLEHLAEIDRRRLYAMRGYCSLWEYIQKALGYSESQAFERVAAMRLIVRVPEVKEELRAGMLTLTTTAKLGAHVRREKLAPKETAALLQEVVGKTSREVERILVAQSCEPKRPDRVRAITQELTRVTMEVDEEFLKLVQQIKDLKGNPALAMQEIFKTAMQEYVKRREPKMPKGQLPKGKPLKAQPEISSEPNNALLLGSPKVRVTPGKQTSKGRYIPVAERAFVKIRSEGQCEFADPVTKRRCESRSGLEFDHIKPFAMGGVHTSDNLRHYCKAHNTLAAIEEFAARKWSLT